MQVTDKEIIKKISNDISILGTKYIVDIVRLCDKYEIDRDSTLGQAVTDLGNLIKKFSFKSMNTEDAEWNKKLAEIGDVKTQ